GVHPLLILNDAGHHLFVLERNDIITAGIAATPGRQADAHVLGLALVCHDYAVVVLAAYGGGGQAKRVSGQAHRDHAAAGAALGRVLGHRRVLGHAGVGDDPDMLALVHDTCATHLVALAHQLDASHATRRQAGGPHVSHGE